MKTGKIGGGDGGLTINNHESGKIESAVESSGALTITNNGKIEGTITASGVTDITNNGTISAGVTLSG
ncbi:hypothetical protein, partial [Helicobacter bilis]|uniref:hypothetical protein n=2 Tax=Helicobacter bilis TaxID=37372 RepID=UPI0010FECCAB